MNREGLLLWMCLRNENKLKFICNLTMNMHSLSQLLMDVHEVDENLSHTTSPFSAEVEQGGIQPSGLSSYISDKHCFGNIIGVTFFALAGRVLLSKKSSAVLKHGLTFLRTRRL